MAAERMINACATLNLALERMNNVVRPMLQREMGAPARAAQFQTNQGGNRIKWHSVPSTNKY
jgi:hypothetical protein